MRIKWTVFLVLGLVAVVAWKGCAKTLGSKVDVAKQSRFVGGTGGSSITVKQELKVVTQFVSRVQMPYCAKDTFAGITAVRKQQCMAAPWGLVEVGRWSPHGKVVGLDFDRRQYFAETRDGQLMKVEMEFAEVEPVQIATNTVSIGGAPVVRPTITKPLTNAGG